MRRLRAVFSLLAIGLAAATASGQYPQLPNKTANLATADKLFGERYSPPAGKPLRLFDEQTETGPPDAVLYWHGASYVIRLVFGAGGSIARIELFPEALMHSNTWSDVPDYTELSSADMQWFLQSAEQLRPLGKPANSERAPNFCSLSGQNQYCTDNYEQTLVQHYHQQQPQGTNPRLRQVSILYRQSFSSLVEDVRTVAGKQQLKIANQWYREELRSDVFKRATKGTMIRIHSFGCAANQKACLAIPE